MWCRNTRLLLSWISCTTTAGAETHGYCWVWLLQRQLVQKHTVTAEYDCYNDRWCRNTRLLLGWIATTTDGAETHGYCWVWLLQRQMVQKHTVTAGLDCYNGRWCRNTRLLLGWAATTTDDAETHDYCWVGLLQRQMMQKHTVTSGLVCYNDRWCRNTWLLLGWTATTTYAHISLYPWYDAETHDYCCHLNTTMTRNAQNARLLLPLEYYNGT